jgi:hypothetical protein
LRLANDPWSFPREVQRMPFRDIPLMLQTMSHAVGRIAQVSLCFSVQRERRAFPVL